MSEKEFMMEVKLFDRYSQRWYGVLATECTDEHRPIHKIKEHLCTSVQPAPPAG